MTFNISDLIPYKGHSFNSENPHVDLNEPIPELFLEGPNLSLLLITTVPFAAVQIDSIRDDQVISTRDGVAGDI